VHKNHQKEKRRENLVIDKKKKEKINRQSGDSGAELFKKKKIHRKTVQSV